MSETCPTGALACSKGIIRFGPREPLLCVNDQCGYLCQEPSVIAELQAGCFDSLIELAKTGIAAGISVFNVQLMQADLLEHERRLVPAAITRLVEATDCCIAVDSRDPQTVDAALAAYPFKALCNSVTGERSNLDAMLPVIAKHRAAVGTALIDEKGIPQTVAERVSVAKRIVEAAEAHGIPRGDVIVDAVCLPSSAVPDSMRTTLGTLRALHEELGVPTLLGISNAGFGMPRPQSVDLAYLIAAATWGLDVAMVSPTTPRLAEMSRTIDFLRGRDRFAKRYLEYYRASLRCAVDNDRREGPPSKL